MLSRTNVPETLPMPPINAQWIQTLDRHLGWDDLPRSWRLLSAVLHALSSIDAATAPEAARQTIRRCGTMVGTPMVGKAAHDLAHEPGENMISLLLQQVATGFMPDRLESPEEAILAVLDVLESGIDWSGLDEIRQELQRLIEAPHGTIPVRWKPAWLSAA